MTPSRRPASPQVAPTAAEDPEYRAIVAPAARTRAVSFYDEQKRRRRQTWRLSLVCLLLALVLGVATSTIIGPLLLATAGGALKLAALLGCANACDEAARGIGLFARDEIRFLVAIVDHGSHAQTLAEKLAVGRELLAFAIVLVPALLAGAAAWTVIHRSLARAGMVDLVATTQARAVRPDDPKERQLVNAADEMAIAAGLPTPRIMVIDATSANAVVTGTSHQDATVLVTRALIDLLERDQVRAVMAHCVASIGNGDQRIMQSLLATFQTLGLFHTILDLPFRASAWRALGGFARATLDPRTSPEDAEQAARGIEASFAPESIEPISAVAVALMPFRLVTVFHRLVLMLWCNLVASWPLALMWRGRRYLADSTAVQLNRNPDALASALSRLAAHAGVPPGGERRDYLFMWGTQRRRGAFRRYGVTRAMHPRLDRRLRRLDAMGAAFRDASAPDAPEGPSRLRRVCGYAIFLVVVSPFLLIGALAALALVGAILWISLLTVFISLLLGLGFLAWAFGP